MYDSLGVIKIYLEYIASNASPSSRNIASAIEATGMNTTTFDFSRFKIAVNSSEELENEAICVRCHFLSRRVSMGGTLVIHNLMTDMMMS